MGSKVLSKAEQSFIQLLLLKSDKVIAKIKLHIESNLSKNIIKVQFGKNIMLWKIKMKDKKNTGAGKGEGRKMTQVEREHVTIFNDRTLEETFAEKRYIKNHYRRSFHSKTNAVEINRNVLTEN